MSLPGERRHWYILFKFLSLVVRPMLSNYNHKIKRSIKKITKKPNNNR